MPIESVKERINNLPLDGRAKEEIFALMSSLVDGLQALAAKLDADAANTQLNDTNYAATLAQYVKD